MIVYIYIYIYIYIYTGLYIYIYTGASQKIRFLEKGFLVTYLKNVLGYYRNLGSLRYGTSTASCKDAYGKMPFFPLN